MPLLASLKKNLSGGSFITSMVKPSVGDQPPSDEEGDPSSQTSTSCASASHPSLSSGDMSGPRVADLGQGAWWICSSDIHEAATSSANVEWLHDHIRGSSVDAEALAEALAQCVQADDASGSKSNVTAFFPEEMQRLGKLRWDGDGHYVLDQFPGEHPPTLGQIITYLKMVDSELKASRTVVHVTSHRRRAVSAVLAGAFLVLARGLTPEEAWERVLAVCDTPESAAKAAWDRFPPPFSNTGETGPTSLTVYDCLRGLAAAREHRWLEDFHLFDVEAWKLMREKFDASWLIPGEILAMANPLGTSQNPRFPGLLERGPAPDQRLREDECLTSSDSGGSIADHAEDVSKYRSSSEGLLNIPTSDEIHRGVSWKLPFSRSAEHERLEADTFISLMLRSKVFEVTRLNYDYECKDQNKYEKAFMRQGVRVHHLPFTDGDVPSKAVVNEFLKQCKKALSKDGTIALHCMGGMGRTGVMAGTHAAAHHQVDGKAFHGWTRICRPGTVQTVKQEEFLRGLDCGDTVHSASSVRTLLGRIRCGSS
mmetsp:Transcript_8155/g.19454  ORF Transcript_8155/g.19454 Transcript_8155/m.19454 type:complete len:538 (+) Transcript_8155:77-1690(+)